VRPMPRADSPAGRAHLLTQSPPRHAGAHATGAHTRPGPLTGTGIRHQADGWPAAPGEGSRPDQEAAEEDEQDDSGRRRLPVVKSALAVLLLVIIGAGYAAWRYTQSQYFVGVSGSQVVIYRGVNQRVAGLSLYRVYQHTGIPLSHVTSADLPNVRTTITASSLSDARKTVLTLQHDYTCQVQQAAVSTWLKDKPKPVTKKVKVHGRTVTRKITPPYRAEPTVPAYCKAG
jgi:hypothetical protein